MVRERPEKECTPGRSGPLIFLAAAAIMMLLALYVLSIGPVAWMVDSNYIDGDSTLINMLYTPLGWLAGQWEPLEWALEGYMELFR